MNIKNINFWHNSNNILSINLVELSEALVFLFFLYLTSLVHYGLFHSLAEIFSVIIAFGIFIVVWNAKSFFDNHFLLFLSIAYAFTSFIDIAHALSYKGIGVFSFFDNTSDLPTKLWIAARYLQAFSLLSAPLFLNKKINIRLVTEVFVLATIIIFASIFYFNIFPTTYIEGVGLTPFKKISEYVISLILAISAIFLFKKRKELNKRIFYLIFISIVFTIASEITFTTYLSVFGYSNMLGHFFKIISFLLLYKTIVEIGLRKPLSYIFRKLEQNTKILKASESKFHSLAELATDAIILTNEKGDIDLWNSSAERTFGWKREEVAGKSLDFIIPEKNIKGNKLGIEQIIKERNKNKYSKIMEFTGKRKSGEMFPLEFSFSSWKANDELFICYIIRDISSRKKIEKDLNNKKKKLEALVDNLKMVQLSMDNAFAHIVITDENGSILYTNKAAEEITGYKREELLGKSPAIWGRQMHQSFYKNFWKTIKDDKKNFTGQITNKRKSGELYDAEVRVSPVLNNKGEVKFFVAIERDITEEKEMDRVKTEFISLAAHQLRTPLSTISIASEMLLKGIVGDISKEKENKKYLTYIFTEIRGMVEMIETFLNVSRIELGKFPIHMEEASMLEIIEKSVNEISPQIKYKKIHFKKDYIKNLPIMPLDKKVMQIILENLLSNAIKYSPINGQINLGVEESDTLIIIKVSDNGIGIPEKDQSKIFTKMFRAENASQIKSEGSGLGLYLVKSLAEQSGYSVSFKSKENEGTTFIVSMPKKSYKKFIATKI